MNLRENCAVFWMNTTEGTKIILLSNPNGCVGTRWESTEKLIRLFRDKMVNEHNDCLPSTWLEKGLFDSNMSFKYKSVLSIKQMEKGWEGWLEQSDNNFITECHRNMWLCERSGSWRKMNA